VFDLLLALEQRARLGEGGSVHLQIDRKPHDRPRATFGDRCEGTSPTSETPSGGTRGWRASA
jgi:hypothetical protein